MEAEDAKAAQRELYEAGEYHALSAVLAPSATALAAAARVQPGDVVLDVAAGDGNVAIAAARRGARVTATDLSVVQVQRGRERCAHEGVDVAWTVADAEQLPFADGVFDGVLSAFGVVFAPAPETAAGELFRVCRSGGTVGLTAWASASYMVELASGFAAVLGADAIPDRDSGWGEEDVLRARLEPHADALTIRRRSLAWDPAVRAAAGPADCAAAYFRARVAAERLEQTAVVRQVVEQRFRSADGKIVADYLLATARAR